jgi:hypothetical protein
VGDVVKSVVECHSGFAYPDHPLAFIWQNARQTVNEVLSQWRTPQGITFRVLNQQALRFELTYSELNDEWRVSSISSQEADNIHG